ncbi:MAG TPA: hypothetical protein VFQ00_04690 [Terriglobales bacterium]|nr:hypothetical protein [Terriglobales bacterium]
MLHHARIAVLGTLLCCALFVPAQSGSPQKPTTAAEQKAQTTTDREAFTFLYWDLNARIQTQAEALEIRGKLVLRNDSSTPQKQVALQVSSSLRWASVRQNVKVLPFTNSNLRSDLDHTGYVNEAVVTLPAPISPGEEVQLEVAYSGTVSLDTSRLAQIGVPLEIRTATDYDRITPTFTCLRGVGHVLWFPVAIEPALLGDGNRVFEETGVWQIRHALSNMKLEVSTDSDQPVYSNAQSRTHETTSNSSSLWVEQWKHIDIAGPVLVSGAYQSLVAKQEAGHLPFALDFFSEHEAVADDYARVIHETLPTITGSQNLPVSLADLPEASDTSFDADGMFLTPIKPIDRKSLEVLLAYQFAHQTLWSPRPWIYEGAAHFAQALMRERQDGRAAGIEYMSRRLSPLALVDSGAPEALKTNSLINTSNEVFYRTKAMYVWWMLREIAGERAVLDTLQQYDPAQDKEASYLQRLLEKNSHKDLEWFFDDWVYQDRGLAEFTISNAYARPSITNHIYLVSATVDNTGGASAEVPVIVHTDEGEIMSRLRVPAHGRSAVRVEVSSRPIDITVNDGSVPEADRSDNTVKVKIGSE